MKNNKRFQECNWLVKIWRYRFYIPIPFKWIYYMYIKPLDIIETKVDEDKGCVVDTENVYNPKGKNLYRLLIGMAQGPMKWYYTSEEVMDRIKNKYKDVN